MDMREYRLTVGVKLSDRWPVYRPHQVNRGIREGLYPRGISVITAWLFNRSMVLISEAPSGRGWKACCRIAASCSATADRRGRVLGFRVKFRDRRRDLYSPVPARDWRSGGCRMSLLVTAHERYARFGSRMAIGVVPAVGRLVRSSTWPV